MSYRIEDEPQPGALAQWVVDPLWPLLTIMFGGAALSWIWFVWNGFAVGSPSRKKELALAVGGFFGSFAILIGIIFLADAEILSGLATRYALIVLTVWKLGISYWLYTLQTRGFHLYEYFGGAVKNGLLLALVGGYFFQQLLYKAELSPLWIAWLR